MHNIHSKMNDNYKFVVDQLIENYQRGVDEGMLVEGMMEDNIRHTLKHMGILEECESYLKEKVE